MTPVDRAFSEVIEDIIGNVQEIVRSEVRLAKTEIREEAVKARSSALLIGAGAVAGLFATLFVLLASLYALALVMPRWAAALVVGTTLAALAGLTLAIGLRRSKHIRFTPIRTLSTLKEDVEWAKQQTK